MSLRKSSLEAADLLWYGLLPVDRPPLYAVVTPMSSVTTALEFLGLCPMWHSCFLCPRSSSSLRGHILMNTEFWAGNNFLSESWMPPVFQYCCLEVRKLFWIQNFPLSQEICRQFSRFPRSKFYNYVPWCRSVFIYDNANTVSPFEVKTCY